MMVEEAVRLETLRGYGVLDTPNELAFDHLVLEIARTFRVRSALISFIDEYRQWYKAKIGVEQKEVPRSISFCTHSIVRDGVTVVLDAARDEQFRTNPFVTRPNGIRFYAAAPIKALNRARIGTVCIFDEHPRAEFSARSRFQLSSFAAQVVELLIARQANRRAA